MLNNISWANYLSTIVFLLLVYYSIVGWKFYPQEIKEWLSGKRRFSFRPASSIPTVQDDKELNSDVPPVQAELFASDKKYVPAFEEEDDIVEKVKELTFSLKEAIAEAVENNYIKVEFFYSLQRLLKRYSFLKDSPALVPINNLIASECEKYGYIQLSAEERMMLWNE